MVLSDEQFNNITKQATVSINDSTVIKERESLKRIQAGKVQDRIKKFAIKEDVQYDEIESVKEKRMSINKGKRDSVADVGTERVSLYGRKSNNIMDNSRRLSSFLASLRSMGSLREEEDNDQQSSKDGHSSFNESFSSFMSSFRPTASPRRTSRQSISVVTQKLLFSLKSTLRSKKLTINENKNEIFDIVPLKFYTPLEIMDLWFSEAEMQEIKWDNEQVAQSMDDGMSLEQADGRGVENLTEEGNWKKYKTRKDAINEVLDEFDRQSYAGIVEWDFEKLQEAYQQFSTEALKEATELGTYDEMAVQDYLQDTRKESIKQQWNKIDQAKLKKKK